MWRCNKEVASNIRSGCLAAQKGMYNITERTPSRLVVAVRRSPLLVVSDAGTRMRQRRVTRALRESFPSLWRSRIHAPTKCDASLRSSNAERHLSPLLCSPVYRRDFCTHCSRRKVNTWARIQRFPCENCK